MGEGGGYKTSLRSEAFVNWYVRSLFGYISVTVAVFLFQGERKFKNIDHTKIYTPLGCNIRPRIGRKYIMMGKENNKKNNIHLVRVHCHCNSNATCLFKYSLNDNNDNICDRAKNYLHRYTSWVAAKKELLIHDFVLHFTLSRQAYTISTF